MHPTNNLKNLVLLAMTSACLTCAHAQPVVDAGSLQKQTEQGLKYSPISTSLGGKKAIKPSVPSATEATVRVNRFQFAGNTLLTEARLNVAVEPYLNRSLTFTQLQEAVDAVATAYREAGWLVRVYLPKQEITNGNVNIQIVEALFGKPLVPSDVTDRVPAARLVRMVESAQPRGQAISASGIDRALLLLDDLPGVNVSGNLVEGQRQGETDLLLAVTAEPWIKGGLSLDNYGSESTGTNRLSANMTVASPLRLGDAVSVNAVKAKGSDYQRLAYSIPLGDDGWRGGVHETGLNYTLLGSFANSGGFGSAQTLGADLSYPLVRAQQQNINFSISYDDKRFDNQINSGVVSNYKLNVYNFALSGNQIDDWQGGGGTNATVGVSVGNVNLAGSPNQSSDAGGPNTAGGFNKINASIGRIQTLNSDLSAYVGVAYQAASKNLDSSEKLYLSGPSGVRAYPSSEGAGATGHTVTAELRKRLNSQVTLTGFYDYGHAQAFKNNMRADGTGDNAAVNAQTLRGYGASLQWQPQEGVDLKATWARRVGVNPLAKSDGQDSDGTKQINRVWLSASVSF